MSDLFTNGNTNVQVASTDSTANNPLDASNISRVLPRQLSTGSTRGTQTVGYGDTKIDGSNNTITVGDSILLDGGNEVISVTDTTGAVVGMGRIPGTQTEFGFFGTDASGNLVFKYVNGTWYDYDPSTSINYMQHGILPDGTGGWAIAAQGDNVSDAYSG